MYLYSLLMKLSVLTVLITSLLVIVSAVRSVKEVGGTLGQGLKKVAGGTIIDTILIIIYMLLEAGNRGFLNDNQVRFFFLFFGVVGSTLLISGYLQIYKIAKRLKLFTV